MGEVSALCIANWITFKEGGYVLLYEMLEILKCFFMLLDGSFCRTLSIL